MASMLATLDITKAVDEKGNVIEPEIQYDNSIFRYVICPSTASQTPYRNGTIRIPNPFAVSLKPRSEQAVALMKSFCDGLDAA
jgi:hypothetical protein